ncbi:MAG TPA: hypothetical protein VNO32_29955, partial [Candidatus Acidoferrum sp.]|nr:hypothetical protein [Candidatus Acidoferrum sp.]
RLEESSHPILHIHAQIVRAFDFQFQPPQSRNLLAASSPCRRAHWLRARFGLIGTIGSGSIFHSCEKLANGVLVSGFILANTALS